MLNMEYYPCECPKRHILGGTVQYTPVSVSVSVSGGSHKLVYSFYPPLNRAIPIPIPIPEYTAQSPPNICLLGHSHGEYFIITSTECPDTRAFHMGGIALLNMKLDNRQYLCLFYNITHCNLTRCYIMTGEAYHFLSIYCRSGNDISIPFDERFAPHW